jgi:hypothetical protein
MWPVLHESYRRALYYTSRPTGIVNLTIGEKSLGASLSVFKNRVGSLCNHRNSYNFEPFAESSSHQFSVVLCP